MPLLSLQNKNLFLEISPEIGASITKFCDRKKNKNIFRPFPKTKKITKNNCYFSGYFATVPYFGVIHKDTFFYNNKYIKLSRTHPLEPDTIHGEGWVKKWKVKKQTKTSAELIYVHQGKSSFPHKYQACQKFSLNKTSLNISIRLTNLDHLSFDCGIGFHPWFNISAESKIFSNNFSFIENNKNNFKQKKLTTAKLLNLNKHKIDKTFLNWNGKSKLVLNKDISLEIINKKNLNNLHVYTPPKENFFCIEPVTNIGDAFQIKKYSGEYTGLKNLKKNKKFESSVEFKLL